MTSDAQIRPLARAIAFVIHVVVIALSFWFLWWFSRVLDTPRWIRVAIGSEFLIVEIARVFYPDRMRDTRLGARGRRL